MRGSVVGHGRHHHARQGVRSETLHIPSAVERAPRGARATRPGRADLSPARRRKYRGEIRWSSIASSTATSKRRQLKMTVLDHCN